LLLDVLFFEFLLFTELVVWLVPSPPLVCETLRWDRNAYIVVVAVALVVVNLLHSILKWSFRMHLFNSVAVDVPERTTATAAATTTFVFCFTSLVFSL